MALYATLTKKNNAQCCKCEILACIFLETFEKLTLGVITQKVAQSTGISVVNTMRKQTKDKFYIPFWYQTLKWPIKSCKKPSSCALYLQDQPKSTNFSFDRICFILWIVMILDVSESLQVSKTIFGWFWPSFYSSNLWTYFFENRRPKYLWYLPTFGTQIQGT